MDGRPASPYIGIVHDVVMDKREVMDQLYGDGSRGKSCGLTAHGFCCKEQH